MDAHRIFLTLITAHNLLYSSATIIIKLGLPSLLFNKLVNEGIHAPDPLTNFGRVSRQILCDTVLSAKQYVGQYANGKFSSVRNAVSWEPSDDVRVINYQRKIVFSRSHFEYRRRTLIVNQTNIHVRTLPCMKSSETAWHVTFGKKDKFMFLVEPLMVSRFRLTGIVEPSAVLVTSDFNENELVYFSHQIIAFADVLESLIHAGTSDRVRACASVFDVLSGKNLLSIRSNRHTNYVRVIRRHNVVRRKIEVELEDNIFYLNALPCWINSPTGSLGRPHFYLMVDAMESDSVFVLVSVTGRKFASAKWLARVKKVGALLNPMPLRV